MFKKRFMILLAVLGIFILPFSASAAVLLDQPLDGATPPAYTSQWAPDAYTSSIFIADDFTNAVAWDITKIFIPGNFNGTGANNLNNANFLNWQIYTDTAGTPAGCPQIGENAPIWSVSLAPTDSQVAIAAGSGGFFSNVTLTLTTPINLAPGTYWLLFYPEMDYELDPYDGYYGRQPATTTNGATAKARNPQGGLLWNNPNPTVTTWVNWMDPIIGWGSPTARTDTAFRLEGDLAGPNITVSAALAFGNQKINTLSAARTITISNTGTLDLSVSGINITGTNANQFAKAAGGSCGTTFPKVLTPGTNCTQNVTFTPTSVGAKTASVDIASNDPDTATASVGLSGTGTSPNISVSSALAFGDILVGATSGAQTVTISNIGDYDLSISNITITGDSTQFAKAAGGTCGTTFPKVLAPGANCTQNVTFSPTTVGLKAAFLAITSDDPDTVTANVGLGGTGISPNIAVTPASLAFGSVPVNTLSAAQQVTISNATGTSPLNVSGIAKTGTDTAMFTVATGGTAPCASLNPTIAVGANCTVIVTFTPSSVGAKTATLAISSNDLDTPTANVGLGGTGISAEIAVAPTALDFDPIQVGQISAPQILTIENIGLADLVITNMSITGTDASEFAISIGGTATCTSLTPTIIAGENCTVNVDFRPDSNGAKSAILQIDSADPVPTANVPLTGSGIQGAISLFSPNGGTFGTGDTMKIEWEVRSDVSYVNAKYTCDSGTTWTNIVKKQSATTTTYDWDLPLLKKNKATCKVKVWAYNAKDKQLGSANSSSPFSINVMQIVTPATNEIVTPGNYVITWTENTLSGVVAEVRPYYSLDNGTTWKPIKPWLDADTGSASWVVPEKTKNKCKVKVVLIDASGKTVAQTISGQFSIAP